MGLCPPGASSPRREDATEASAQARVHAEAQGHRGAGGGGRGRHTCKPQTTLTVLPKVHLRATHEQPGLQTHQ